MFSASRGLKSGLSVVEYAILMAVVVGALMAMQTPLRRAISDKWRSSVDQIGHGRQYDTRPGHETQVVEY